MTTTYQFTENEGTLVFYIFAFFSVTNIIFAKLETAYIFRIFLACVGAKLQGYVRVLSYVEIFHIKKRVHLAKRQSLSFIIAQYSASLNVVKTGISF
jgi:hypothetical protein